jgi:ABC-type nickel/cobalt efflux system permease component RcnA
MWYRRAVFNTQFAATIILPLWLLIGRVFFGVILGWHYAIGLFLAPLLFVFLAVVATLTWARKRTRRSGAVSRTDAALLSFWYFAILCYGFFVIDSVHSEEPGTSIATKVFGQQFRDASFTIADISGGVIIVIALTTFWVVLIEYLIETRPQVVKSLTGLEDSELGRVADEAELPGIPDSPPQAAST